MRRGRGAWGGSSSGAGPLPGHRGHLRRRANLRRRRAPLLAALFGGAAATDTGRAMQLIWAPGAEALYLEASATATWARMQDSLR